MLTGQARKGEDTRRAVVDAALDVFAEKGFRGSALAEVAARCDLTPAGILYHFGSKKALLLAVIAERDRRAGELLAGWPGQGLASLLDVVAIAELCEREPGLAALHTVLQVESFDEAAPAHAYFTDRSRFLRGALRDFLVDCRRAGEVRPGVDPGAKADEIVAFLEGAAVLWLLDPAVSLVSLYTNYLEALIASIATEEAWNGIRGTRRSSGSTAKGRRRR